jgi:UDP-2,3-diacylglucosamine pyrophosphatase LpxH
MKKITGTKYKSVFISDLHLGSKHCNSEKLLEFLDTLNTEKLYLVGDIVDGWRLHKKWYWPKAHNKIVQKLIKISKKTEIIYITGNHDEFLRTIPNVMIGKVAVENRAIHEGIDGKRYLVVHGDMFDNLMRTKSGRFIMHFGDVAYDGLIYANRMVNAFRSLIGKQPWSLAKFLKRKAKTAANYIGDFETQMAEYCRNKGYDGIICGHIHHASIEEYDGIVYMNDGDWCESCTALVETQTGKWEIING